MHTDIDIKLKKLLTKQGFEKGTQFDQIVRDIIEYLRSHPAAADSIEGILGWWLPAHRNENARNEILQALHDMMQHGLLVEDVPDNGSRRYRLVGDKDK